MASAVSIVVRARPDRVESLKESISALGFAAAPQGAPGRLVVSAPAAGVATALSLLAGTPGVIDAAVLAAQSPRIPA